MAIESVTEASPRATAAERVFEALRGAIVGGELPPGAPLTEVEQASRLGVSRTPIREAFARLIAAGLVTERGPRTLVVSDIDADDVSALFDLRRALDEQAARLAAQRTDSGRREQFTILARRFADAPAAITALAVEDPARNGYYALVAEFDAALDLALTNSPYLAAAIASTRIHLTRVRRLAQDDDARLAASAAEHGAIARAIADGDPERAAAATRLHLHEALTSIRTRLPRSGNSTQETP
jgi:DNA-binding GntR family transcriptional regulator